ncbi:MAG TPA: GGDEF domain-containing protein [Anaeromyxobacteraceae bacterium]|nr:GGDEF domain-containing protein [Anaeromyxobacteraceae bacterium]
MASSTRSMSDAETRIREQGSGEAPSPGGGACLVVVEGDAEWLGRRIPLDAEVVLGRDAGCGVRLESDDVSRRHARVAPAAGGHAVADLGSTNGTFVNGEEVRARRLARGDLLRVGPFALEYRPAGDPAARLHAELHLRATVDPLTRLLNRGAFEEALAREVARARRGGTPLAVLIVDVDHFKRVNDGHGHAAGDAVLREIASRIAAAARGGDVVGRIGGEEMAVALPGADLAAAREAGERIRARVAGTALAAGALGLAVTVSIGAAALLAADADAAPLLARADARLYQAKRSGRDRVCG